MAGALFGSAVGLFAVASAASADVFANASYRNGSGQTVSVEVPGIVAPNGWVWFNKTVIDGPYTFIWNYNVNPSAANNGIYNGSTTIKNLSASALTTRTTFEVNLCPKVIGSSQFGGTANVKLIANTNGGQVICGPGPHLTGVLVGGVPTFVSYWCPFLMTSTGAGTAQTSSTFGQPIPSAAGPSGVSSIGHFTDVTITDGDTVIFTGYAVVAGEASYMPAPNCPFDINGDGIVDKWDLTSLLLNFGDSGNCVPEDLNGDGVVNGGDLGMLIGMWGDCPE